MIAFFRKLWKDKRGNAIMIAGAALPMIVGCAGLASDTIQWTLWKRQLQRAADSAAIAGVYDRVNSEGSTATVSATVAHDVSLNLHTWYALKTGYPKVDTPADSGSKTDQVHVTLALQKALPFSSMFMNAAPLITANATAAAIPGPGDPCVRALMKDPKYTGVKFSGDADIEMADCDIFSNSPAKDSSTAKGSSHVHANTIGGVGGIMESDNFQVKAYRPYAPEVDDPYKTLTPSSSDMHCAQTPHTTTTTQTITVVDTPAWTETVPKKNGKGTDTIFHPAVTHTETQTTTSTTYSPRGLSDADSGNMASIKDASGNTANCFTDLSVASGKTLDMGDRGGNPIYINAGNADIQGNLSCTNCTIVLTNLDMTNPNATIGQFKVNASSNINMSAPTTGTWKGMAIYQDRRAQFSVSNVNKINGNSGSVITGALYFPKQKLEYNGTGNTAATCTMFVTGLVEFTGNSTTSNKFKSLKDCVDEGLPQGGATKIVRLVA